MFTILLIVFLFLVFLNLEVIHYSVIERIVLSFATLFLVSYIITETLSLFNAILPLTVKAYWILLILALLKVSFEKKRKLIFKNVQFVNYNFYTLGIGFLVLTVLLIAVFSPITNGDSLTYHLSRVMYWIQHQNVEPFATNNHRQISYQPLAEYAILNIKLLGGKESLANLIQWISYLGCILNTILIGRQIGLSEVNVKFSAFLVATIPMAILQASGTQNDLLAAFFVGLFVVGYLTYSKQQTIQSLIFMVVGLSLGGLTKGTSYVFILPFCIALGFKFFRLNAWNSKRLIAHIVLIVSFYISINGIYFSRNFQLFENIFGTSSLEISNEIYGIAPLLSNASKQFTLHLGFFSPGNVWNNFLSKAIENLHEILGLDSSDLRISFGKLKIPRFSLSEDYAGNTLHFLLILLGTLIGLSQTKNRQLWMFSWGGFVIFCILIKWQIFASRLFLPWFIISMPLVVSSLKLKKRSRITLSILVFLTGLPFLLLNSTKPLISYNYIIEKADKLGLIQNINPETLNLYRSDNIFATDEDSYFKTQQMKDIITLASEITNSDVRTIGLDVRRDFEEYLLHKKTHQKGIKISHIFTEPPFNKLEKATFKPEIIVTSRGLTANEIYYNHQLYLLDQELKTFNVYSIQKK